MPLGVSELINIVSSMVIRKNKLVFLFSGSPYFFSHCSEFHQELLNSYFLQQRISSDFAVFGFPFFLLKVRS